MENVIAKPKPKRQYKKRIQSTNNTQTQNTEIIKQPRQSQLKSQKIKQKNNTINTNVTKNNSVQKTKNIKNHKQKMQDVEINLAKSIKHKKNAGRFLIIIGFIIGLGLTLYPFITSLVWDILACVKQDVDLYVLHLILNIIKFLTMLAGSLVVTLTFTLLGILMIRNEI